MANTVNPKLIHLLYVPTLFCNLRCSYCYLEEKTGNIFQDTVEQILQNAHVKIALAHINSGLDSKCMDCEYLGLCKTGCPFVKCEENISRSYTCKLQKCIYKKFPQQYKPFQDAREKEDFLQLFLLANHPEKIFEKSWDSTENLDSKDSMILSKDFYDAKNALTAIIRNDSILQHVYSTNKIFWKQMARLMY